MKSELIESTFAGTRTSVTVNSHNRSSILKWEDVYEIEMGECSFRMCSAPCCDDS